MLSELDRVKIPAFPSSASELTSIRSLMDIAWVDTDTSNALIAVINSNFIFNFILFISKEPNVLYQAYASRNAKAALAVWFVLLLAFGLILRISNGEN